MSSDRYMKAVLTVIAGCLVYMSVALTTGPGVSAQTGQQEVVIVGWKTAPGSPTTITFPPFGAGRPGASCQRGYPLTSRA